MKRILVLATGGTIASADAGAGLSPALSGAELIAAVPGVADLCEVDVRQVMNVDSTNMEPAGWLTLARALREAHEAYDGFVVLHGTDTLAYTAAGLSYLAQNLRKPVVLTGSQLPMAAPGSDAARNVLDAVRVACDDAARGVLVAFGGAVIAGTRARKVRTLSFNAFESVNFPELASIDERGRVRWREAALTGAGAGAGEAVGEAAGGAVGEIAGKVVAEAAGEGAPEPRFYDRLNTRVQVLSLAPGVSAPAIEALRAHADALVVEAFGLGGVPTYGGVAASLLDWAEAGKTLVFATQCPFEGCDPGTYEVGRAFCGRPGVLVAGDMTREAALAKTMWALAEAQESSDEREPAAEQGLLVTQQPTTRHLGGSAELIVNREKLAALFAAPIANDRVS